MMSKGKFGVLIFWDMKMIRMKKKFYGIMSFANNWIWIKKIKKKNKKIIKMIKVNKNREILGIVKKFWMNMRKNKKKCLKNLINSKKLKKKIKINNKKYKIKKKMKMTIKLNVKLMILIYKIIISKWWKMIFLIVKMINNKKILIKKYNNKVKKKYKNKIKKLFKIKINKIIKILLKKIIQIIHYKIFKNNIK